ncbi:5-oxoprolinase subunit PxpB [Gluconacetobacter azotocaptans]|uniref:5-oxoprolinase subunit PxpB n=1 Tax=Gluconacetobacter azotocaptans TaxID=142834 RepID=A0A7W4JSV8_9PROT|nr:5-oxoprolinase subunit PxpB [Gluconacetobacter azotocaptans]MBB2190279.1 5-oxoprolinase subunit PxpB [Gluconacetobacter azotocaptans]MBM9400688.1 5-oxoprolinase subunit PxpB [Gluconacetobacter azotocaptans]GBQ27368.1 hypothetical protein AA13594_0569 [Gluconacetobacter azotocaptans DSM 13594]
MIRISMAGAGALLLDAANGAFSDATQQRIWATARLMGAQPSVIQAVPGVNNLLVTFDVNDIDPPVVERTLLETWDRTTPETTPSRDIEIPVTYGGDFGEDLALVSHFAGLSIDQTIALHTSGRYSVAAIGAMPGFAYLTGLDPRLAIPRRDTPRLKVEQGAVCIGGGHAGVMPCTSPSGWHILGRTDLALFDAFRSEPCLLRLGDTVRFVRVP